MMTLKKFSAWLIAFVIVTSGISATYWYIHLNDWHTVGYWVYFIMCVVIVGTPAWEHWHSKTKNWFKL